MGLNVVLLGYGAIGRSLHGMLARHPDRIAVIGVLDGRAPKTADDATGTPLPVLDLATALGCAEVIAECASPAAVREFGPDIIASGTDLLIASLGALVDPRLRGLVLERGPGRAYLTTGAIGGLDLVRASAGTIDAIDLDTRKPPAALLHPGLPGPLRAGIAAAATSGDPCTVFSGSVERAVELFPSNINVAAALALAAGGFTRVHVTITADPAATLTRHEIRIQGSGGNHTFLIGNAADPENPATSALTARAMASGLLRLAGAGPHFI
ncbi:aspartate dehydrogenase domain-containing protein [Paeniglutamicibacter kerguelensis]|uniref:L-aspartate dehydrogenase n=1 Tax=Paeniglutamicibacter kerguelensis TaxID=254788 RepID=A0ABS4XD50_9MICC|nr:aspartate dehydrogenase domain-containing protein [Paeniglutamicibacter kerguelensis]MBP2386413.1 aspartate dehydrogenase [Paeniglutamicibacter kerguelensis]